MEWVVSKEESGTSLQGFIAKRMSPAVSAKQVKRSIDAGQCTVNGKPERFGSRPVGNGDRVEFRLAETKKVGGGRVIYADDALVAYDKPPGIVSDSKGLQEDLKRGYGEAILLHRLDKETSGILLFARNVAMAAAMEALFKGREIDKKYHALVDGSPGAAFGKIDNYLGKLSSYQGQSLWGAVAKEKGLPALTEWETVRRGRDATLLACYPFTGRTHQIRVHLSGIGHPILGDRQYGKRFQCSYPARRILLHASEISFIHPLTGKKCTIAAPWPDDFEEAVKQVTDG